MPSSSPTMKPVFNRKSIGLSITLKLTLAMTVMIAGSCVATLFFIEHEIKTTYQRFLHTEFDSQWKMFLSRQESRFGEIKVVMGDMVQRATPLIPLEQSDPDAFSRQFSQAMLQIIEDRGYVGKAFEAGKPFFRYITPSEEVYRVARSVDGEAQLIPEDTVLSQDIKNLGKSTADEVGYLSEASPAGNILYEVIATQLTNASKRSAGTLVLGVPLANMSELFHATDANGHGLLVSDVLHGSSSIPSGVLMDLKKRIKSEGTSSADIGQTHIEMSKVPAGDGFPDLYTLSLFSMEDMTALNHRIRIAIFLVIPVVPIVGFILSIFASRTMTRPIMELVRGTREVRAGNLKVHVPVQTTDEIGLLTASFNTMVEDLALKEKYRHVLAQVTDKDVAERLLEGAIELGGEDREATVLFCDIRGFTTLAEHMQPSSVIRLLNKHMTALTEVVYRHHGVVDKFVGDEIMVIFGVPRSYGDDALNAVRCAQEMHRIRTALNRGAEHPIHMGIGIATGHMVAGCMGSSDRMNYTVVGSKVNLASRLCSMAQSGEIILDSQTYEVVASHISVKEVQSVDIKGLEKSETIYRVF